MISTPATMFKAKLFSDKDQAFSPHIRKRIVGVDGWIPLGRGTVSALLHAENQTVKLHVNMSDLKTYNIQSRFHFSLLKGIVWQDIQLINLL